LLSPFGNIDGLYFDGSDEKNNFMYEFQKDLAEIEKQQNIEYIKLDFDSENDFYNALMEMQSYTNDNTAFYGTSRSGHLEVVVESEKSDDDDDEETPTTATTGRRKKKKSETTKETEVEETEEVPEIEVDDISSEDTSDE
jgi:hypothetical protein